MHPTCSNSYHVFDQVFLPLVLPSSSDTLLSNTSGHVSLTIERPLWLFISSSSIWHRKPSRIGSLPSSMPHLSFCSFSLHSSKTKHTAFFTSLCLCVDCLLPTMSISPSLTYLAVSSILKVQSQMYPCSSVCSTHLLSLLARPELLYF